MGLAVNDFDYVAPFYSSLDHFFFAGELNRSQSFFLSRIKEKEKVLAIGAGNGQMLSSIPSAAHVDFVEKSGKMMELAKMKRREGIGFFQTDFLSWETSSTYDVVICPFFLDCFSETKLDTVIGKIRSHLRKNAVLIVTDFSNKTNPNLIWVMYLFFRLFSKLEAKQLLNFREHLEKADFYLVKERVFRFGIKSQVFKLQQ
ncbi:MAG: methyltransferase domain-containing protein [Bacteroidota bacterium]